MVVKIVGPHLVARMYTEMFGKRFAVIERRTGRALSELVRPVNVYPEYDRLNGCFVDSPKRVGPMPTLPYVI